MTATSAAPDATTTTTTYLTIPAANPAAAFIVNTTITNFVTKIKGSYCCEEKSLCPTRIMITAASAVTNTTSATAATTTNDPTTPVEVVMICLIEELD